MLVSSLNFSRCYTLIKFKWVFSFSGTQSFNELQPECEWIIKWVKDRFKFFTKQMQLLLCEESTGSLLSVCVCTIIQWKAWMVCVCVSVFECELNDIENDGYQVYTKYCHQDIYHCQRRERCESWCIWIHHVLSLMENVCDACRWVKSNVTADMIQNAQGIVILYI